LGKTVHTTRKREKTVKNQQEQARFKTIKRNVRTLYTEWKKVFEEFASLDVLTTHCEVSDYKCSHLSDEAPQEINLLTKRFIRKSIPRDIRIIPPVNCKQNLV